MDYAFYSLLFLVFVNFVLGVFRKISPVTLTKNLVYIQSANILFILISGASIFYLWFVLFAWSILGYFYLKQTGEL